MSENYVSEGPVSVSLHYFIVSCWISTAEDKLISGPLGTSV